MVHSSGSVTFCWEDKPGIPKAPHNHHHHHHDCSSVEAVPQNSGSTTTTDENHLGERISRTPSATQVVKIPMPPCRPQPDPPRRITFWKGFRRQQDPFLVAYKHCTKTPTSDKKDGAGVNSSATKTKLSLSCKSSSVDAMDDHFLKPSMPPRLPHASNPSSSSNT